MSILLIAAWGIQPACSVRVHGYCSLTSAAGRACLAEQFPITSMSRPIIVLPELADSLLNSEVTTGVSTVLHNTVCAYI